MLGFLLRSVRAGRDNLLIHKKQFSSVPTSIQVTSKCFCDGCHIPDRYTQFGDNLFPELQWLNLPGETKDTVLIIEDADAPLPFPFVHTIVYNLGLRTELPEGSIPNSMDIEQNPSIDGFRVGRNTFRKNFYAGPGPIKGHGPHHYYIEVLALNTMFNSKQDVGKNELLRKITGHVIAKGYMVGIVENRL